MSIAAYVGALVRKRSRSRVNQYFVDQARNVPTSELISGLGPEIRGTGETLALAQVGRRAVLDELDDDGVGVLAQRIRR